MCSFSLTTNPSGLLLQNRACLSSSSSSCSTILHSFTWSDSHFSSHGLKLHSNERGASNGSAPFVANFSPEPSDQQMVIVDTKLDLGLTRCLGKKSGMRDHNTAYPELSMGLQLNTVSTAEFPTYQKVYAAHLKLRQATVGNRARSFEKKGKEEVERYRR